MLSLFKKKETPLKAFKRTTNYPVEPIFMLGGKTYYTFTDKDNIPAGRSIPALKYYIPLKTNCDEDYLKLFVKAFETVLNDPASISIEKLITLKNQLKDRTQWAFTPDLVYKYASVVYFDELENPSTYDEVYAEKKIAFWKQHAGVMDFFLTEPIMMLMPSLATVKDFFPGYLTIVRESQLLQLDVLSQILSSGRTSPDEEQSFSSVITKLRQALRLENYPLQNTSFSSPKNYQYLKN